MDPDKLYQRYQDLQHYVGWTPDDAERIVAVADMVTPRFDGLVDDFYDTIQQHAEARKVVTGGAEQIQRLKVSLRMWLVQLFSGQYDSEYVVRRWRVGLRHVEIGLDQVYTNAALSRLKNGLLRILCDRWQGEPQQLRQTVQSLNRLLDLDLAIIEDAYENEHLRRQQRAERQRSESTFRNLVEAAGCMIVILRGDGSIAYFSPFAEQLTGYSAKEVLGRDYLQIFLDDADRPGVAAGIRQVLEGDPVRGYQNDILCRDGRRRTMLWNARRLDDYNDQPVVLAVGQDITSLCEAQSKALQSERLAAIGHMSTGLAHESRNALQRIQACAEMLELEVEGNTEALDLVRRIFNAQDHMHRLFDEVRGYAAPIKLDRAMSPLTSIWREAWELLGPQRKDRHATLCEDVGGIDPVCYVDHFRLVQVFRNLLENSLAACEDPVEIVILGEDALEDDQPIICVTVRDNGPGFHPEQRQRVFQPFYTTKTKGTGLGMSIAQRIVEAHGGSMSLGDNTTPGAEVRITLPRGGA
jgi:two-component system sensor kinase FixL